MTPLWPVLAVAVVLGLAVGSFLNVVIHRLPRSLSIVSPRSACPSCATVIRARHNVPVVRWLVLRGRCASCRTPISVRYPAVELTTGVLFGAVAARFGVSTALPAFLYLAAVAVALVAIDLDVRRVPSSLLLPSYVAGIALLSLTAAQSGHWWPLGRALLGMVLVAAAYAALARAYPRTLRREDVALAGLVGIHLGWLAWSALLVGVLVSFALLAVAGVSGLLPRHAHSTGAVRPTACLVAAAFLSVFLAAPIVHWYGALALT